MVLPLHQLSSPGYSGMTIGGVNECKNAGYQGAGNGQRYDGTWRCVTEKFIVVGYISPPVPPLSRSCIFPNK